MRAVASPMREKLTSIGLALAIGGGALLAARLAKRTRPIRTNAASGDLSKQDLSRHRLNSGAALLAFTVLADSALEHYRGAFENRAMFVAPAASSLTLAAATHGLIRPAQRSRGREAAYAGAVATGLAGLAFHTYNIGKREGGFGWLNLFYAAPVGAPAALALAGIIGISAERLTDGDTPTILGIDAAQLIAGLTSAGLIGTVAEVGLLHFRGAYQNPFMYVPVTVAPLTAAAAATIAFAPKRTVVMLADRLLAATALLGLVGTLFHSYGIQRSMGGWRNWSQNLLAGPPLPAPIAFIGLALAGRAAVALMPDGRR